MYPFNEGVLIEQNDSMFLRYFLISVCLGIFLFSECSIAPRYTRSPKPVYSSKSIYKGGKSVVNGAASTDESYRNVGIASYYAKRFDGRRTASGEIFYNNLLTAAHPTLPFGTIVKVTCLENNLSVIVRINDRGPFSSKKRIIDLSQSAARELGFLKKGITRVSIEVVNTD